MSTLATLGTPDLAWLAAAVDVLEQSHGRPWRDALDRLDDLQRAVQPAAPRRFSTVVGALQRIAGGRADKVRVARQARELVLGHPVFSALERQERMSAAAQQLGVTIAALEKQLWCDVPRERPVELPRGRPSELEVAAFANVALIQRALRRAHAITVRTTDDAGSILRTCARRGLLATATVAPAGTDSSGHDTMGNLGHSVRIDIVGPLALFHRTNVYGRALAEIVPLLGELRQSLEICVATLVTSFSTWVTSPVALPPPPAQLAAPSRAITRLARELVRAAPELVVTPAPPPLVCAPPAGVVLAPDLRLEHGAHTTYVEIVSFWTTAYIERKLASYERAGVDAIVCPTHELDATSAMRLRAVCCFAGM